MTAALVAAVEKLAAQIARLEKAARQPERKAYKPSEVAAMLGLKEPKTVREMIQDGRLAAVDMGGWYLIPAAEVDRLLATDERRSA